MENLKTLRRNAKLRTLVIVCAAIIIVGIGSFVAGRSRAKVETVTVTQTVEVPVYDADRLPEPSTIYYHNVPLSQSLQRFITEACADEGVPVSLILAMIDYESGFDAEAVSETEDYGLMQINKINHDRMAEEYRAADMMNPYQNVYCGIKIIGSYLKEYDGNFNRALMAYNFGEYGADKAIEDGYTTCTYANDILELMNYYEGDG